LGQLAAAVGPTAWAHSGISPERPPVFGCYAAETLAAAGMLEPWGARLLHVGIVTHPAYRGRGYGKAVVSAMTTHGLTTGAVVQYRTLAANRASVAIAQALGFQRFGQTLAVRLLVAG
jgi:RimJ/RimL family protein N-acetyltransferase